MRKFFFLAVFLALLAVAMLWMGQNGGLDKNPAPETGSGTPAVGGDFTLTGQDGKEVKDMQFRGRNMLVFFGFTRCPDICPVSVNTLSRVMESLGDKASQVAPIFISVDPEYDTPETMRDFLANFDKGIVGLTGTKEQIKQVASAYKAYYSETSAGDDASQMSHSGLIYLMGRDGRYIRHFPYDAQDTEIFDALKPYLK